MTAPIRGGFQSAHHRAMMHITRVPTTAVKWTRTQVFMECGQSDPALAAANSEIHLVAEHIRGNWSRFAFDGANTCTPYTANISANMFYLSIALHGALFACMPKRGLLSLDHSHGADDHTHAYERVSF